MCMVCFTEALSAAPAIQVQQNTVTACDGILEDIELHTVHTEDQHVTMCPGLFAAGLQSRVPSSVHKKGSGEPLAWAQDNLRVHVLPYLQGK